MNEFFNEHPRIHSIAVYTAMFGSAIVVTIAGSVAIAKALKACVEDED